MENYIPTSNSELYHWGIKGMKWGVRRFQKKDGSLTAAGKKRYDDSGQPKKSQHRIKLEEAYRKRGLSQKEAEAAASKRIRTEKILGASAALTVGACVAYAAVKSRKARIDGVIKSGETMQRIEMKDTNGGLHDVFYVSKGKHDNQRYYNVLGATRQKQTGQAFLMNLESSEDIKVASRRNAEKVFKDLYNSDQEFRLRVNQQANKHFSGRNKVDPNRILRGNTSEVRKLYENFNSNLIDIRDSGSGADKKFYNALKSKGYGAIQDINDMKFSGYNAKNPLIIFDNSKKNVMVTSVSKIEKNLAGDGFKESLKAIGETKAKKSLERWGPMSAGLLTVSAVSTYASDPAKDEYGENYK